jgi:hypothetical protein
MLRVRVKGGSAGRGDNPQFIAVIEGIRVPRLGGAGRGRARIGSWRTRRTPAGVPVVTCAGVASRRPRNRGVATRYDKLAVRYEATVAIAAINEWL